MASGAAPGAPSNLLKSAKPAKDDGSSGDDYDDDFDDVPQLGSADINANSISNNQPATAATKATPSNAIDFSKPGAGVGAAAGKIQHAEKMDDDWDVDIEGNEDQDEDEDDDDDWGGLEDNDDKRERE